MSSPVDVLVRELYAVIEARDLRALAPLLADDVRWSAPASIPGGGIRIGCAAVLEGARLLFAAYPDVHVHLDDVQAEGDRAVVRGRYEVPPDTTLRFNDTITVRDGVVAALLSHFDGAALARALRRAEG
ncbi:nuclear transport factor 2 family protein [Conexibacter sp. SYSU D00693]|uniref:nuclear transport factor 2 family protein n=1 Tax=Conexibacter sp. SYSU D00693 TaxID=2812560 RepID=UPI00196BA93A|nr:nuclear transport factor 2 family protein [Conexibacter sp. SYSU D00693]